MSKSKNQRKTPKFQKSLVRLKKTAQTKVVELAPVPKAEAKPESKQNRLVSMLRSPSGATLATMMKETGWQQHSVRGFLAGVVRRRLKYKLESQPIDGNRVYRIIDAGVVKAGAKGATRGAR